MTDYSKLFYWVSVADNATTFFGWFAAIFTLLSIIAIICFFVGLADETSLSDTLKSGESMTERQRFIKRSTGWVRWGVFFMIMFWGLLIFTPNKKQSLLIIAGGQTLNYLTRDSVATQIPHEVMNFVISELKTMAADAKVDLGLKTEKEKLIESLKGLSGEEVLIKLKDNPDLLKLYLEK